MAIRCEHGDVILSFRGEPYEGTAVLTGQYAHLVGNKILYQAHHDMTIRSAELTSTHGYEKRSEIILQNSMAVHNFRVIEEKENITDSRYVAVGGVHYGSSHKSISGAPESKQIQDIQLFDPVWPDVERCVMDDSQYHSMHANGIYAFSSNDLLSWDPISLKPLVSSLTACKDLPAGTMGPDSMPSLVFNDATSSYMLYIRANIRLGVRHVLTMQSKDLVEWSVPELIDVHTGFDFEHDNFYYFEVIPFKHAWVRFLAYVPFFKNDVLDKNGNRRYYDESSKIFGSPDGQNWYFLDDLLFPDRQKEDEGPSGHMTFPHALGVRENDEHFELYVHEKFLTPSNYLKKYTVPIDHIRNSIDNKRRD